MREEEGEREGGVKRENSEAHEGHLRILFIWKNTAICTTESVGGMCWI